jgi:hypothetical protein
MYEIVNPNSSRMPQLKRSGQTDFLSLGRQEKEREKGGIERKLRTTRSCASGVQPLLHV